MKANIIPTESGVISPKPDEVTDGEEINYIFEDGLQVVNIRPVDDQDNISQKSSDSGTDQDSDDSRATWGGQLEFILTCVGYAVGLGNVWRFPYLCYKNGGGAFLIPYTLMLGLVGLPLFFMELSFGQYAGLGPITIWRLNPLLKGLGYAMVIVSWLIGLYYNVIISHVLYYLVSSFTSVLPWTTCNNTWNTENCLPYQTPLENGTAVVEHSNTSMTPSEEYYRYHVLDQTGSIDEFGSVEWQLAVSLLVAWFIVWVVLIRGIQSLGKVVYFTAIFPYVMLTVLFFRGVTLPGAGDGIIYYLKPDFARLADPRVWSDACTQIFYSLSACSGGLIAMSSYNKFKNNCYRDALIVCIINCSTSVFAGLVIFSILGYMAAEKGVTVDKVAASGPGLAFIVYPEALARMPVSPMWSVFFFIMMATLGFGSEFSIVECVLSALTDEFTDLLKSRRASIIFRTVIVVISFLLGLPMVCRGGIYLLNMVDYSVGGFPLLVVGFMELVAINWIYGYYNFAENIEMMLGRKPNKYWEICWRYISPLIIAITVIMNIIMYKEPDLDGIYYPEWAKSLGWLIVFFPIVMIPGWFIVQYCREGGYKLMVEKMKPLPTWAPASDESIPEINVRYTDGDKQGYNPAFARLMGSNVSNSTTSTDITNLNFNITPMSSTLALTKSTDNILNKDKKLVKPGDSIV